MKCCMCADFCARPKIRRKQNKNAKNPDKALSIIYSRHLVEIINHLLNISKPGISPYPASPLGLIRSNLQTINSSPTSQKGSQFSITEERSWKKRTVSRPHTVVVWENIPRLRIKDCAWWAQEIFITCNSWLQYILHSNFWVIFPGVQREICYFQSGLTEDPKGHTLKHVVHSSLLQLRDPSSWREILGLKNRVYKSTGDQRNPQGLPHLDKEKARHKCIRYNYWLIQNVYIIYKHIYLYSIKYITPPLKTYQLPP